MGEFTRRWQEKAEITKADLETPIRQVYVWLLTTDGKMVVVSKDGQQWQLPGGKPEPDESLQETVIRETAEETGVDITPYRQDLNCFGYYTISEPSGEPQHYLQVRMIVRLPMSSKELSLRPESEHVQQIDEDVVRHVGAVSTNDIVRYIPWMSGREEYRVLKERGVI